MRKAILLVTLPLIALGGCGSSSQTSGDSRGGAASEAPSAPDADTAELPAAPITARAAAAPDPSSAPLTTAQAKGAEGAQAMLRTWARALETHRFDVAWQQFRDAPADQAAYAKWWSRYRIIKVAMSEGHVEGAAGSLYYEVRATLTGMDTGGKPFRLEGPVVARRVNDVDGATPEQLRWHIASADLKAI